MSTTGKAPAVKLERLGACAAVGSWSPGPGRRRVLTRCKCKTYSRSVTLSTDPAYPTCVCGHTQGVHGKVEVQS